MNKALKILKNLLLYGLLSGLIIFFLTEKISRNKKLLTYKVVIHEKLFETDENMGLKILVNDSITLDENLFIVEIDLWNQGRRPIEENDIKELFGFKLEEGYQFISNVYLKETHSSVTKAKIEYNQSKRNILIDFNYLEKRNGIKVKTYYSSEYIEKSKLEPVGYIGQTPNIKHFNSTFTFKYGMWVTFILMIIGVIIVWRTSLYLTKYIDDVYDKVFGDLIPSKIIKNLISLSVLLAIVVFLVAPYLSKIPLFLYDLIADYFNMDSPFSSKLEF
jgi:hypothetical protein